MALEVPIMVIKFKSKAAPDLVMLSESQQTALELLEEKAAEA